MTKKPLEGSTVGERIRSAYELAGMNRNKFAKRSELDYGAIMKWEKGDASPTIDSLERVAKTTDRDVAELVGGRAPEVQEEHVERVDALSPYPDFEAALEAEGLVALAAANDADAIVVVRRVRGVRFAGGAAEGDYAEALHQIARAKADLRGKAVASKAPTLTTGKVPAGKSKVGPARKR